MANKDFISQYNKMSGYLWLVIFPEAFINGMLVTALVPHVGHDRAAQIVATGIPPGLGDPVFDKLKADEPILVSGKNSGYGTSNPDGTSTNTDDKDTMDWLVGTNSATKTCSG